MLSVYYSICGIREALLRYDNQINQKQKDIFKFLKYKDRFYST